MKSVLVTGGSGLVGNALQQIEKNYRGTYHFIFLDSKKCDLTDYNDTLTLFKTIEPDIVIHLAACVGGLFKNMSSKVQMLEDNLIMNTNVLNVSHFSGGQSLVACLSTCVFQDNTTYPINE
jgi:GDP-L-fucose synthase